MLAHMVDVVGGVDEAGGDMISNRSGFAEGETETETETWLEVGWVTMNFCSFPPFLE
jgi:hypothetical protein